MGGAVSREASRQADATASLSLGDPTTEAEARIVFGQLSDAAAAAQSTEDEAFVPTADAVVKRWEEFGRKWGFLK